MINLNLANKDFILYDRMLKLLRLRMEFYEKMPSIDVIVKEVRNSGHRVDIITFVQDFPGSIPVYDYYMEYDHIAAIPVTTYKNWYREQIKKQTRRGIRIAHSKGVKTKIVELDDDFVNGVQAIYNESPLRQGRPNYHYNLSKEVISSNLQQDSERTVFIGAYRNENLIGYIKLLLGDKFARTSDIVALISERAYYPTNALISKAIEICVKNKKQYLVYGLYDYGKVGNLSLQEFKYNNGFEDVLQPRYYIPLTNKGKLAIILNLHAGIKGLVPEKIIRTFIKYRNKYYALRYQQ